MPAVFVGVLDVVVGAVLLPPESDEPFEEPDERPESDEPDEPPELPDSDEPFGEPDEPSLFAAGASAFFLAASRLSFL